MKMAHAPLMAAERTAYKGGRSVEIDEQYSTHT